ncbi:unnamed protein product [Rangifer tarandus platyrhynchus]|uniref:Uncharacterized protein n=1 Tax=Rangifer tarandus platyrhynchus TaxID=3082113 RepID=A0ABN8Y806_RANTA|nr:unnamed protein product [Rangifer tarandus platyrhynchus]
MGKEEEPMGTLMGRWPEMPGENQRASGSWEQKGERELAQSCGIRGTQAARLHPSRGGRKRLASAAHGRGVLMPYPSRSPRLPPGAKEFREREQVNLLKFLEVDQDRIRKEQKTMPAPGVSPPAVPSFGAQADGASRGLGSQLRGVEKAAATGAHSWARQIGGTRSSGEEKKAKAPAPSGLRSGRRHHKARGEIAAGARESASRAPPTDCHFPGAQALHLIVGSINSPGQLQPLCLGRAPWKSSGPSGS